MNEPTERFPAGAAPGRQNTPPMPPVYSGQGQPVYPPYPPYPPAPQGTYPGYPPVAPQARPARQARMPKERAQQIIHSLRTWIAAGSIVAFGVLAGLAASHVTGVTSAAASNTTQQNAPVNNPNVNSGEDDGGGFFTQQPGGFGVGSGNSGQAPFTSSSSS